MVRLFSIVAIALLLAACGTSGDTGSSASSTATSPSQTAPASPTATGPASPTADEVAGIHLIAQVAPEGPREIMDALLVGVLETTDGCLTVDGNLLIWPPGTTIEAREERAIIHDRQGRVVAEVGEEVQFGGGHIGEEHRGNIEDGLEAPIPEACQGPFWIVGDFIYPSEETPTPVQVASVEFPLHAGPFLSNPELIEMLAGVLSLDGDCLRYQPSDGGESLLAVWPRGLELDTSANPPQIRDVSGQVHGWLDSPLVITGLESQNLDPVEADATPSCPGPYLLVHRVGTDDALAFDAASYAVDVGVSLTEAIWRLDNQGDYGTLQQLLVQNEAETFAGFYIQHEPDYGIVVLFTENGEETLGAYTEGKSFDVEFEVRHVRYSYAELQAAQQELIQINQAAGIRANSSINIMENQAEVYVVDRESFDEKLAAAGLTLPEAVRIIEVPSQDVDD